MKIAVLKEKLEGEKRVAAIPETVKKLIHLGFEVSLEKDAGAKASYSNEAYEAVGGKIESSSNALIESADLLLTVRGADFYQPSRDPLCNPKDGAYLLGLLSPYQNQTVIQYFAKHNINALSLELIPRITRAQSMDVLSSQANLAGYRAVIEGAFYFNKALPMMMTAAGTIAAAKVLVIGAGVAGLQAIATAKRMGAVVSAFDVRPAAKEQVESLGGKFIQVDSPEEMQTQGGYAKEVSEDYKKRQAEKLHEHLKKSDIVISTALIPGKPAPKIITMDMVKDMKAGSVIVDLAAEMGGNCEATIPGKIEVTFGITVIGYKNFLSSISTDASAVYARNVFNLIEYLYVQEQKAIKVDFDDEITKSIFLTHCGEIVHNNFKNQDKNDV